MRVIIQRVSEASVTVDSEVVSRIENGALIFLGVSPTDSATEISWLTKKIANLRIFSDREGIMNLSLIDVAGDALVVSQFTLMANTRKGNRPSYINAAKPDQAIPLYEAFVDSLEQELKKKVSTGIFGADMKIQLLNDGPVTITPGHRKQMIIKLNFLLLRYEILSSGCSNLLLRCSQHSNFCPTNRQKRFIHS